MIFEIIIILTIYVLVFHLTKIVIKDHLQVFKVLFNITVLEQSINRETDIREINNNLHFITESIVFSLLTFNSLIQSLFLLLFFAVDVCLFSRLLLVQKIFLIHFKYRETKKIDWLQIPTIVFSIFNYNSSSALHFFLFLLIDDLFEMEKYLIKLDSLANKMILGIFMPLVEIIAFFKRNYTILNKSRLIFIGANIFYLILSDNIFNFNELYFLYYAVYRFCSVYQYMIDME